MYIKVLGPGCVNCELVERRVWKALSNATIAATVEKVTEEDGWRLYWPMATPGLVVNEGLVCAGRVPDTQEISQWITRAREGEKRETAPPAVEG